MAGSPLQTILRTVRPDGLMPRRRVVARPTATERRHVRRSLGSLASLLVSPTTLTRYRIAVQRFLRWLDSEGISYPDSLQMCDDVASHYLEVLWHEGEPKAWAADCLSGLHHFCPYTRRHLPQAWRLYGAWGRHELPLRASPLPMSLAYALADVMQSRGWHGTSFLLLLGMCTMMRAGELFSLTAGQCTVNSRSAIITLPRTKSGSRSGTVES
eukprot:2396895-Amphidinium_carterae.1